MNLDKKKLEQRNTELRKKNNEDLTIENKSQLKMVKIKDKDDSDDMDGLDSKLEARK